jgi:hypothetical protein
MESRKQALTRGFPNGETLPSKGTAGWIHSPSERNEVKWNISVTSGKENEVIPSVVASERGIAQTELIY